MTIKIPHICSNTQTDFWGEFTINRNRKFNILAWRDKHSGDKGNKEKANNSCEHH